MESSESLVSPSAAATRFALACGMAAGPFYLAVGLAQGFLREGFVFSRHSLSVLTNGPGGWIQTANFVITGLMVLCAAAGIGQVLGPKSRATAWFLGGYGLSMIMASMFKADPIDGFPPGTPTGIPTSISTTGLIHFAAGALGFTFLAISCFAATRAMRRRGMPPLAWLSLFTGVAVVGGFFGGIFWPIGGVWGIWFAVVAGWAWLSVVSLRLNRPAQ